MDFFFFLTFKEGKKEQKEELSLSITMVRAYKFRRFFLKHLEPPTACVDVLAIELKMAP